MFAPAILIGLGSIDAPELPSCGASSHSVPRNSSLMGAGAVIIVAVAVADFRFAGIFSCGHCVCNVQS